MAREVPRKPPSGKLPRSATVGVGLGEMLDGSSQKPPGNAGRQGLPLQGERALITGLRRQAARHASELAAPSTLRLGIGDDCAIVCLPAWDEMVVTTDLFLEQVHFRRDWHQPEVAGHRCLARGLSDIAAMGATPVAAFLSFALPAEPAGDWTRRFLAGLLHLARIHKVPLAGGDTAQAPACLARQPGPNARGPAGGAHRRAPSSITGSGLFTADIVLLGSVRRGTALLRSGAKPGDQIYVTGSLGGAAAELALLAQAPQKYANLRRPGPVRHGLKDLDPENLGSEHPHLFPQPRLAVGLFLRKRATAAIDISDGLSTDLMHLCEESSVAGEIDATRIPIHPLASRQPDGLDLALHGGEDYELLFTAPRGRRIPAAVAGTPIHRIGTIVEPGRGKARVTLIDSQGRRKPLRNLGWEHFGKGG